MYNNLFKNLSATSLILTINRRLSAFLHEQYTYYQQTLGNTAWITPTILPLTAWLERCWQSTQAVTHSKPLTLLNAAQELALWKQILTASTQGENLLRLNAAAQMAYAAWQLAQQWQLDINHAAFASNEDTATWQTWAKEFQKTCDARQWLDTARLPDYVVQQFKETALPIPKQIFLAGFDELNPQQQIVLTALADLGCDYQHIQCNFSSSITKIGLTDTATEIQGMARWCRDRLQINKNGLIGCVVPNLTEIRDQLVNTFNEIFSPASQLPGQPEMPFPFNISSGEMLDAYPLIRTALTALAMKEEFLLEDLSYLLRSPYLGEAEQEITARALLDVVLREQGEPRALLQQVITLAKKNNCLSLAERLQRFTRATAGRPYHLPSQWAEFFSQQLKTLGWPGERTLDSTEYQLCARWNELLIEFAKLDLILGNISQQQALQQLTELMAAPFQPQSAQTPIQILGVLEAAGLNFQHLWIMGLHDNAWPPPANPNPFIPHELQRTLGMPHASNERELQFCRTLTERLTHSAPTVIVSFPQQQDDQLLRPSPLLQSAKSIELSDLKLSPYTSYNQIIFGTKSLETFIDAQGPQILAAEKISGGTAIFKHQAACPFRAFAYFRLDAEELASTGIGLNLAERGILLHRALEALWNQLGSQEKLLNSSTTEINAIIETAINSALQLSIKNKPLTFQKQFIAIEKQRLFTLLSNWLEKEKDRPPFKVLAIEQNKTFTVAHIPLQLRVDRIDELPDGSQLIIDYKTSKTDIKDWFGERLDEPQLPLYCIAADTSIQGLLFAQIRSSELVFKGITNKDLQIPGVKTLEDLNNPEIPNNWQSLLEIWRIELEKLAEEFQHGNARVDPKYDELTCRYCDLQTLCRIKS
jgi:ATP-dependent helicase/nuclease subunit B